MKRTLPLFGKFSRRQNRIGNTTPKRMNRRYYKGKNGRSTGGKLNSKGIFVKDQSKIMTIIPPKNYRSEQFHLKPYVETNAKELD